MSKLVTTMGILLFATVVEATERTCETMFSSLREGTSSYQQAERAGPENRSHLVGKIIWGYQRNEFRTGTVISLSDGKVKGKSVLLAKLDRGQDWREDVRYATVDLTNGRFHISADPQSENPPPLLTSAPASAAFRATLTMSDRLAMTDYFVIGQTVNAYLRNQAGLLVLTPDQAMRIERDLAQIKTIVHALDDLVDRAPPTEQVFEVFRGEKVPRGSRKLIPGTVLDDYPDFMSLTTDRAEAKSFAGREASEHVFWHITIPKGSKILSVAQVMSAEDGRRGIFEFLPPRHTKLRITGTSETIDGTEVSAEAILP